MRSGLLALALLAAAPGRAQNNAEPQYQLTGRNYSTEASAIQQMFYNTQSGIQALQTQINGLSSSSSGGSVTARAPTYRSLTGVGTYTTPAGVKWLKIRLVGGGGAGGCNNSAQAASASSSTFNGIAAFGGVGGFQYNAAIPGGGGIGGSTQTVAGVVFGVAGGQGGTGSGSSASQIFGGVGGSSCLGGGGGSSNSGGLNGSPGAPLTGAGGGGGSSAGGAGSGGGGAGACETISISPPSSTYSFSISTGAAAPTGCSQGVGGPGASGSAFVEEHYNY